MMPLSIITITLFSTHYFSYSSILLLFSNLTNRSIFHFMPSHFYCTISLSGHTIETVKNKSASHDRQDVLASLERIQNFEEAFNKIKSATGVTDIDELVKTFIKNEDHNFSLFNYVNEQNNEVEKIEEQILCFEQSAVVMPPATFTDDGHPKQSL